MLHPLRVLVFIEVLVTLIVNAFQFSTYGNKTKFSALIDKLSQGSGISNGFGFRVSAFNSKGIGKPSEAVFVKPKGRPLPPENIELIRDASSTSAILLYFTHVIHPEDRGDNVHSYVIQYGTDKDFNYAQNLTVPLEHLFSHRLSTFRGVNKRFLQYSINNLDQGKPYFVRVASMNDVGIGRYSFAHGFLVPGGKPSPINGPNKAKISAIPVGDAISVLNSSTSLEVEWQAPLGNGFKVHSYLLEYWTEPGTAEIQELFFNLPNNESLFGTFTLTYDGESTDSLHHNASALDVEIALMSFKSLRKVHVDRVDTHSSRCWRITFLSEYPSISGRKIQSSLDTNLLSSESVKSVSVSAKILQVGIMPKDYRQTLIHVQNDATRSSKHTLTGLKPGQEYFVQVSAGNDLGYGVPVNTIPEKLAPPKQRPSLPRNISLSIHSATSLSVYFRSPESNGGDEISQYKIEWDRVPSFDSGSGAPEGSYSYLVSSQDSCSPCSHVIRGLDTGVLYFVRVLAYNAYGFSWEESSRALHVSLAPKTTSEPPDYLRVSPNGNHSVKVSFPKALIQGGENVTKYKLQWKSLFNDNGIEGLGDRFFFAHGIQSISLEAFSHDVSGGFFISFEGLSTRKMVPINASSYHLKRVLEEIPTIGSVVVSKSENHFGWKWLVTFLSNSGNNGGVYGNMSQLLVSIDLNRYPSTFSDDVRAFGGSALIGTGARIFVKNEAQPYHGFEQQSFTSYCKNSNASLYGTFHLIVGNEMSEAISFQASPNEVKNSLQKLKVGLVKVSRAFALGAVNAYEWNVIFLEKLGDLTLFQAHSDLMCSDNRPGYIRVLKVKAGRIPHVEKSSSSMDIFVENQQQSDFEVIIGSLNSLASYYFNVRAWNGVNDKYGNAKYSTPASITPIGEPDPPTRVTIQPHGDSSLFLSWEDGLSLGGAAEISKFRVEWGCDRESYIEEVLPMKEVQMIRLRSKAQDIQGYFTLHFMNQQSTTIDAYATAEDVKNALEGISTIDAVEVSKVFTNQDSSMPWLEFGFDWIVTFSSSYSNFPSILVNTGAGPNIHATGGTLKGSNPRLEVHTLVDSHLPRYMVVSTLKRTSVTLCKARIFAHNHFSWSKSSEFQGNISPGGRIPGSPQNVQAQVLSSSEVVISWKRPKYDGGSSVIGYSIQWDIDYNFDYKSVSISASEVSTVNEYMFHIIKDLMPGREYMIRVLAQNSYGLSPAAIAEKATTSSVLVSITLEDDTSVPDSNAEFHLEFRQGSEVKTTFGISVWDDSKRIESALKSLAMECVVSVKVEDHSRDFDTSGVQTSTFRKVFHISFYGNEPGHISISGGMGTIKSNITVIDDHSRNEIRPVERPSTGPRNVSIHSVSKTEIGVKWEEPHHNGGVPITKYLVEWSKYPDFHVGETSHAVVTGIQFQIQGLETHTKYYVRVSAYNNVGYSDAVSSQPKFLITSAVSLHSPTSITLSTSQADIPNRLHLEWALPTEDSNGFSIMTDECGASIGSMIDPALSYVIEWDTDPLMKSSISYEHFMDTSGPSSTCCPNEKCFLDIGSEVQTIFLRSAMLSRLTQGGLRVLYLGMQGPKAIVLPAQGSDTVKIISYLGNREALSGDFIQIFGMIYRVISAGRSEIILDSKFTGFNEQTLAYFNSVPDTCFNVVGGTAQQLSDHIAQNFDHSPFDESIRVTQRKGDTDKEVAYDITFIGPSFSIETEQLLIVSSVSNGGLYDTSCDDFILNDGESLSALAIVVNTRMDSLALSPGVFYYVKVSAKNIIGNGTAEFSQPKMLSPKSSSYLPQDCRVYIVPKKSDSLLVKWKGVSPFSGEDPKSYRLDFSVDGIVVATQVVDDIHESSEYTLLQSNLMHGLLYEVLIVPINSMGIGGPAWFSDIKSYDSNFTIDRFRDFKARACYAIPTCPEPHDDCVEENGSAILLRTVPKAPHVGAATHFKTNSKERFSKDSIHLTFASTVIDDTSLVTKYMIEWSTESDLRNSTIDVTADSEYTMSPLDMGRKYYVRVRAHNSAGYSEPSSISVVIPMTNPDPPFEPKLVPLSTEFSSLQRSTSLLVQWKHPRVDQEDNRPDTVGDGGGTVDKYLLEWSNINWDEYSKPLLRIKIGNEGEDVSLYTGTFRLQIDSSLTPCAGLQGVYVSALIPARVSTDELKVILQNVPNVGVVQIHDFGESMWDIEFSSHLDANLNVELVDNKVINGINSSVPVMVQYSAITDFNSKARYFCKTIESSSFQNSNEEIIKGLLPGHSYFVRISSGNQVGFSRPRMTTPAILQVPQSKPLPPTSKYHDDTSPNLLAISDSEILIEFGPPIFNGGSRLTSFLIEWDDTASFDNPIGHRHVAASYSLCSNCIQSFNIESNRFIYDGNNHTVTLLQPQRKISIYFADDRMYHDFEIQVASDSFIEVSEKHLRSSSLFTFVDEEGISGSEILLLGGEIVIPDLESNHEYFVRIAAENAALGAGKAVLTTPPSVRTHCYPNPPMSVHSEIVDKHTVTAEWTNSKGTCEPDDYAVEIFTANPSATSVSNVYGTSAIIELETTGLGIIGGIFTLQFGLDFIRFDGVLGSISKGSMLLRTTGDLTPILLRGSEILLHNQIFHISEYGLFASDSIAVAELAMDDIIDVPVFIRRQTAPIPFDADEYELSRSIQNAIGFNTVRREEMSPDGFKWIIMFRDAGPREIVTVNTRHLVGINKELFSVSTIREGSYPVNHKMVIVKKNQTELQFTGLKTGSPYYVSVRSVTDKKMSIPIVTSSPIKPAGTPESPVNVKLKPLSEKTLLLTFETPLNDNGSPINEYSIQVSEALSFETATTIRTPVRSCVQRLSTTAHTLPWDLNSSFTLSLGDYHGDFSNEIIYPSTVMVEKGEGYLIRSSGATNLNEKLKRNSFLRVGGLDFTVCLDPGVILNTTHVPLCHHKNPELQTQYQGLTGNGLPVFGLDTTVGSFEDVSFGDSVLRMNYLMNHAYDIHDQLNRGDYIMLGHPIDGQVFRISTNNSKAFTPEIIPLADVNDPSIVATVGYEGLKHSSYEVQEIIITASIEAGRLTPSQEIMSSFRLQFDTEVTRNPGRGGSDGCMPWDGTASELKAQLESLSNIDSISVSRELVESSLTHGEGVRFKVTFNGRKNRGNVSTLQIVDIGNNGCADASNEIGGSFSQDFGVIRVSTSETSSIHLYRMQTTKLLPYDASEMDVKAAIESLTRSCRVEVTKQAANNGNIWDITFSSFKSDLCSETSRLYGIIPNGEKLEATVGPKISATSLHKIKIPVLKSSIPYYVRIASVNAIGQGPWIKSNPFGVEATSQVPGLVTNLYAEPISDTGILVQWEAPNDIGGSPITHFKVEYDEAVTIDSGLHGAPRGSSTLFANETSPISDIQSFSVMISQDDGDEVGYLSGTFSISFDGQKTGQIPHNAPDFMVKKELELLCTVGHVSVARHSICIDVGNQKCAVEGFTWLVTFVEPGDQHYRYQSKLSTRRSHKLSIDGTYLMICQNPELSSCSLNKQRVMSWTGTGQEIQELTLGTNDFSLNLYGSSTSIIYMGSTLNEVETILSRENVIGLVRVECQECPDSKLVQGATLTIEFESTRGDIPLLIPSDPAVSVKEIQKGTSQHIVGRSTYSVVIDDLPILKEWFIRVYAYNKYGSGDPAMASPIPIRTSKRAPSLARNISLSHISSDSIVISWDQPLFSGGSDIDHYIIEYDTSPGFTSTRGHPIGTRKVSSFSVDNRIGTILETFPRHQENLKRKQVIIDDHLLIENGIISNDSYIKIGDESFLVVNTGQCGPTCITLDRYTSNILPGAGIYLGLDANTCSFVIDGLSTGILYHFRVASVNAMGLTSVWSYSKEVIPLTVPSVVEKGALYLFN